MKQKMNQQMIRLNKYLADSGVDSRRKVEELITTGRVEVNDNTVVELSFKIDPTKDIVKVDGEKIKPEEKVYFLLNKPKGFITSRSDEKNRPVVIDLIKTTKRIFPVGRLDRDTTGLLLLTNDGDFANIFMHPKHKVEREYIAKIDRELSDADKTKLLNGVYLDKKRSIFEKVNFPNKKSKKIVNVVTTEGRYHFVKEMFKALGYHVESLKRIRFGNFILPDIKEGTYINIDKKIIEKIKKEYEN